MSENAPLIFGIFIAGIVVWRFFRVRARASTTYVLVDGSNVLYWRNETPDLSPLQGMVRFLRSSGVIPVIWFDANAGYLLMGRYLGERQLARLLGLPVRQIHVAPKGTPADPLILRSAELLKAQIVTNDRYRDWIDSYPILKQPGCLVRGAWRGGDIELANPLRLRGKRMRATA